MGVQFGRGGRRGFRDINVTPLVDVMLVLLVVFMVTAPLLTNVSAEMVPVAIEQFHGQWLRLSERDQSRALGLECGQALFTHESSADPHVEMQPVLHDLAFGNALEEQPRAHT